MRYVTLSLLGGLAALGFSVPAQAQAYPGYDEHHDQHDQLGQQHGEVHDQIRGAHDDAHAQGINGYDDHQLHHQLNRAHAHADGDLSAEHGYQHQNSGFYGSSGNGGYYGSNGYNGYNYGYSAYNRGYGYRSNGNGHHHRRHYRGF